MNILEFINNLTSISPRFVIKMILFVLLLFYLFFAIILNRQVTLMNKVLEAKFSPVIKLLAVIHSLWVITLFFIILFFL